MNRFLHSLTIGLMLAATPAMPVAQAQTARTEQDRFARIGRTLQDYVDRGRLAGAVVQVQRDGRTIYETAVGWRDKDARDPMRQDTLFRIASQTKALTSVAAMMLMEEGKLVLSDPVGEYLPEWSRTTVAVAKPGGGGYTVVPAKRAITIRDLLTHTSGISYGTGAGEAAWREAGIYGWYFADRDEPVAATVARMAALPMAEQPGEKFVYGYNTDVLGVVVERISGQSLDRFLTERLIRPLGMKDTSFYVPADKAARLATVYSAGANGATRAPDPGAMQGGSHVGQGHYVRGPRVAYSGGAGLVSTAADYSRFLEMLRRGGELDGRRYLGRKTIELMTANQLGGIAFQPGKGFGLGFSVRTDVGAAGEPGSDGDYGWGGAYHSTYWVDPKERLTIVYLTQLIPAGDIDDHGKLRALVYQALP